MVYQNSPIFKLRREYREKYNYKTFGRRTVPANLTALQQLRETITKGKSLGFRPEEHPNYYAALDVPNKKKYSKFFDEARAIEMAKEEKDIFAGLDLRKKKVVMKWKLPKFAKMFSLDPNHSM